jgi:hypothetical protein
MCCPARPTGWAGRSTLPPCWSLHQSPCAAQSILPGAGIPGTILGNTKDFAFWRGARFCIFPTSVFAFFTEANKSRKRAELKTVNGPSKSGVNLDLDSPMEALGWIYAQARRTHARARQGMHERGAPPGGPRIYLKSRGVFGGPGGAPPSCAPRFARALVRLPRAQIQPNASMGLSRSRFTPLLNGPLSVLSSAF